MYRIRVCILTTVHKAFDIRIFHKQAKSLAKAGYDVTLIATHDKEEIIDGVKILPLPKAKNRTERMFINSFRAFKLAYAVNADIYHFHDPELYLTGAFLKIFKHKPVIADAHEQYDKDILSKEWLKPAYRKYYLAVFKFLERISLPFIDAVVYVVPDIGKRFRKLSFKGKLIEVRNYPDLDILNAYDNDYLKDEHKAIFFGGIISVSGIGEIIKAFSLVIKEIPDAKLDLIGNAIPPGYKYDVLKIIEDNNLGENVILHDAVPIEELNKHAFSSSIGLITYLPISENNIIGLPNKIFEYMAFKMAVIASNFPLYKEVVDNSKCGFTVDPTSPEEIAEKIITLMKNPDLCKEFAESGNKRVKEVYNWHNESKKLLDLYEELLKGKIKRCAE